MGALDTGQALAPHSALDPAPAAPPGGPGMRHAFALAALVISATVALVIAVPSALVARDLMADRELVKAQREMAAVAFVVARSADPAERATTKATAAISRCALTSSRSADRKSVV